MTVDADGAWVASLDAAPVPDAAAPAGRSDAARRRRVELLATILLALAAVATAWSTYQSSRWRGDQARDANRTTAAHIAAAEASTRAGQLAAIDVATFTQWVDAYASGDSELADFYRQRFRDEFRPAFDAWLATNPRGNPDAPHTPFEMPQYRLAATQEAARQDAAALALSRDASGALRRSDQFMLAVVLFATSLLFAGISGKFESTGIREALLAIGGLIFIGAAAWVVVLAVVDWV